MALNGLSKVLGTICQGILCLGKTQRVVNDLRWLSPGRYSGGVQENQEGE
jgi:hypothetical protein